MWRKMLLNQFSMSPFTLGAMSYRPCALPPCRPCAPRLHSVGAKMRRFFGPLFVFLFCALWGLGAGAEINFNPSQRSGLSKLPLSQGQGDTSAGRSDPSRVTTAHVTAQLLAHAPQGIAPGRPLWLGLQLAHQPHWHTYWKNPGDLGLPTQLQWKLPAGMQAAEVQWPVPGKILTGRLVNFGYEGQVLLSTPVQITPDFAPSSTQRTLTVELQASWLVCRQECIPEEGQFTLELALEGSSALHASTFEATHRALPETLSPSAATAAQSYAQVQEPGPAQGQAPSLTLRISHLPSALHGHTLTLLPETAQVLDNAAEPLQHWEGTVWVAQWPLSAQREASPKEMQMLITSSAAPRAWRVALPVQGQWPALDAPASISPALQAALQANALAQAQTQAQDAAAAPSTTAPVTLGVWLVALAAALVGGVILNLMPCVFPVLAIKVAGFARHAQDVRAHRLSGLAYTAGVLVSFVALGALMLGLRATGEAVGWGFQLQSPAVVAALALLFTLMGLNLGGLFEFGRMLPSSLAGLQLRHPVLDAFLTGVLAVAVASPCTAPFMGASLGLTATLPAVQALSIFAAIGLGLALPYLLASWVPGVARALPRPGLWMEHLRRLLAFPMFATVVWLVWVLGQQSGIDGAAALLVLLVVLSMVLWALTLHGTARRVLAPLSLIVGAVCLGFFGPKVIHGIDPAPAEMSPSSAFPSPVAHWQPWRVGAEQELLAQGRRVFVDYTAAWCVTCQYNKQTTLADPEVLRAFAAKNVALLRADWTRRDRDITAALTALGRTGVPVYVLHAPGRAPQVLSELLSPSEVLAALAALDTP